MALGNVEMQVNDGSNAEFDMLEFILEQLKKMLQEMLEKMLENGISPESKATQQGLQALSATELELFKNQNPLEYERLKNEQAYTEFNEFNGESGLNDGGLSENLDEINGRNLGLNLNENSGKLSENLTLNLNEKSGKISSENSSLNLDKINGKNSSNEALSLAKQKALKLLQKALSQDLLTQIKNQNLKIIDLRA